MAELIFSHRPNQIPQAITSPGDTGWHAVTPPALVQAMMDAGNATGFEVAICCTNTATTGAGSTMFVNFNQASAPSTGFPILPGQTLVLSAVKDLWYACSVGTDVPALLWLF